ncbi:hypothetical protein [Halorubellus salinus]|uniref:hypothetical protein n=1 Tax=Halorubellus salinus TaxID=755309 RepID=UPI001D06E1D3|nr:hypothetical protein [Halorubellus salinus]
MNRKIAVLMAVLVAVSGAAGLGAAAAGTWDTETTDTTSESDWSGATNTETADWGNASETIYLETDGAENENLTLELTPATKGLDYVAYTNSSPDTVDATNGHYSFNVSYGELPELPRDSNGATYNATIYNSSGDVVDETEVEFNTAANASEDAYMVVADSSGTDASALTNVIADSAEFDSSSGGFFSGLAGMLSFGSESTNESDAPDVATVTGYTTINGTQSDVYLSLENESTQGAYANAAEGYENGDWITGMTMFVNGVPQKVYMNEAPDDVNGTTVVYNADADRLEVSPGEEYESISQLSVRSSGGDGYGFGATWSSFGMWDALGTLWPL